MALFAKRGGPTVGYSIYGLPKPRLRQCSAFFPPKKKDQKKNKEKDSCRKGEKKSNVVI